MASPPSSRLSGKKLLFLDSFTEALAWHVIGAACKAHPVPAPSSLQGGRLVGVVQPLAMPVPGSWECGQPYQNHGVGDRRGVVPPAGTQILRVG